MQSAAGMSATPVRLIPLNLGHETENTPSRSVDDTKCGGMAGTASDRAASQTWTGWGNGKRGISPSLTKRSPRSCTWDHTPVLAGG